MVDVQAGPSADTGWGRRLRVLLGLAWPVMLARAGILSMALVDIVMVGRHSTTELAYAALGMALFVPVLVTTVGALLGAMIVTAEHFGAGRLSECGAVWRRSMAWALALGLGCMGILLFAETLLTLIGHEPGLARGGGAVAHAVAIALPAQLLFACCAFHLEATRRPLPGLIAMILANLLNIALNWVFIYGNLGAPELGAVGSAWTTTATRVFLFLALAGYLLTRMDRAVYGVHLRYDRLWGDGGWGAGRRMRKIGYASAASYGIETFAFMAVLQFAGWGGATALAAYSIAHNLEATYFMAALGLGSAAAVMVGNAVGAKDPKSAAAAGRLGVWAVFAAMGALMLLTWAFAEEIAAVYTPDPAVQTLVYPLLLLAGAVAVMDGAQLVASSCVRALGDIWPTAIRHGIAFLVVMLPLAYLFGVALGYGGAGLMSAVLIGVTLSFALHWRRFLAMTREHGA